MVTSLLRNDGDSTSPCSPARGLWLAHTGVRPPTCPSQPRAPRALAGWRGPGLERSTIIAVARPFLLLLPPGHPGRAVHGCASCLVQGTVCLPPSRLLSSQTHVCHYAACRVMDPSAWGQRLLRVSPGTRSDEAMPRTGPAGPGRGRGTGHPRPQSPCCCLHLTAPPASGTPAASHAPAQPKSQRPRPGPLCPSAAVTLLPGAGGCVCCSRGWRLRVPARGYEGPAGAGDCHVHPSGLLPCSARPTDRRPVCTWYLLPLAGLSGACYFPHGI